MLKVGFARLDVTPPLGIPLAGAYRERISEGVLDPLELNALAACDGDNTVLMITADVAGIFEKWATEIRTLISEQTGVPIEHISIQGLHQHTSIQIGYNLHLYDVKDWMAFDDPAYYDIFYRKFVDVAKMAIADLCEAEMSVAQKETAEQIAFIRRYRMKDGTVVTNPKRERIDQVVEPMGKPDNTVRLVRFTRKAAKDIALVNFSTHPDVIGGEKFSADWPGFVRRMTEKDLPNVHCMVVNGIQGDSNHINPFAPRTTLTTYEYSAYMGRVITDTVLHIWDKTETREASKVSGQNQVKYIPTNVSRIDEIEKCQKLKEDYMAGAKNLHGMAERADVFRAAVLHSQSLFQKVMLSVLRIGEVALVGYGGEPFTEYGIVARASAPDLFVINMCITNDYAGYFPTKEAFEEGGYEAKSTNFTIGVVDAIQDTVAAMLQDL